MIRANRNWEAAQQLLLPPWNLQSGSDFFLQSSTKAANWLPKETTQTLLFLCLSANFSFRCLFFHCPRAVNGVSKDNTVRIWCPDMWWREPGSGGYADAGIMHCLSMHGLIPAGQYLYWAITASARQQWIVLLFWQWSSEGVSHNEFLLIFLVMSSNCMWLESWLLFSHLFSEVPLLLTLYPICMDGRGGQS